MRLGVDLVADTEEAAGVWNFGGFDHSHMISRTTIPLSVADMPNTTIKCVLVDSVAQLAGEP
jgi:hypothetical protein